jgi:hypothetical protein
MLRVVDFDAVPLLWVEGAKAEADLVDARTKAAAVAAEIFMVVVLILLLVLLRGADAS